MINMKDLIKQQGDMIRKETGMIKEATKKWAVKVAEVGTVIVDAGNPGEAKRMVAKKMRGGMKDILSVTKALPTKKVGDMDEDITEKEDKGESTWVNRKFGEPLPTMADYKKAHNERELTEAVGQYAVNVQDTRKNKQIQSGHFTLKSDANLYIKDMLKKHKLKRQKGFWGNPQTGIELVTNF